MERFATFHDYPEYYGEHPTELKHQARLQEWAGAIRDCRSSGLSGQAVVQGERNHTNYILSLGT